MPNIPIKPGLTLAGLLFAGVALAGCNETFEDIAPKAEKRLPPKLVTSLKARGMSATSPIMVRIFKEEGVLEIWKQKDNGRYDLAKSYEICKWSGKLGPKFTEGDRQAPEGFYTVNPYQMNPNSDYHLSFNIGYPNAFDRVHGRTGSNLMVHGACSSSGCYSMTDEQVEQIYAFARDAFRGGQTAFQIEAFPFRMTPANMARYRDDPNYEFWTMLKQGYDYFEITKVPPKVDICGKQYVFNRVAEGDAKFSAASACPATTQPGSLQTAYQSYQASYQTAFASAAGDAAKFTPKPSIAGFKEAALVADWSRRRARGEKVSREPPSLNPTIPATVAAVPKPAPEQAPAPQKVEDVAQKTPLPASDAAATGSVPDAAPQTRSAEATKQPEKKGIRRLWGLFGG